MKTKPRGGSSQDRRRARRAAERKPAIVEIVLSQESVDAVTAAAIKRLSDRALPEREILAAVRESFLHNVKCSCGHSLSEHAGAGGTCQHEDGRGMCACSAYAEATIEESAQLDQRLSDRVTMTFEFDPASRAEFLALDAPENRASFMVAALTTGAAEFAEIELPTPNGGSPVISPAPPPSGTLAWTASFCPEGVLTADGRCFAPGSISWRDLPLSLMAQLVTEEGHDGAQVCGRIDQIWNAGGMVYASGVFDEGEFGCEVARLVGDGVLHGVSVDIAVQEYEIGPKSDWFDEDGNWAPNTASEETADPDLLDLLFGDAEDTIFVVLDGVIGASTVCSFPAFAEATISLAASLVAGAQPGIWTVSQQAGWTVVAREVVEEAEAITASAVAVTEPVPAEDGLTAAAAGLAPLTPPAEWFDDPQLDGPTPLTVTDDGQIFGHAWVWDTCHVGIPDVCTTAPESLADYAYFHLKEVATDDGQRIACGTITLDTGHADLRLSRVGATAHYDDTGAACADVRVGEDEHGGWVAGALRSDISAEKARVLRGASLSGDWRNVSGNRELIALLAVNVPGFPVPRMRALVASSDEGQEVVALVAAGHLVEETDATRFAKMEALSRSTDFAELAARSIQAAPVAAE